MWKLGIRDKKLICIIKQMLSAPVVLPNGETIIPVKGTPQGGIISPLFANIALNELDWWISNQYNTRNRHISNSSNKNNTPPATEHESRSIEVSYVRYADDFKIFCKDRQEAEEVYRTVRQWLYRHLKLKVNEEKSKIVDLTKQYSEYLGFEIMAVHNNNSYDVKSRMSKKALHSETDKLIQHIHKIHHCKDIAEQNKLLKQYNAMVMEIHEYYSIASDIALNLDAIQRIIDHTMDCSIKPTTQGNIADKTIASRYGASGKVKFLNQMPICPIGHARYRRPKDKDPRICRYTHEGRTDIHKDLQLDTSAIITLQRLAWDFPPDGSIEYVDNRLSVYSMQRGRCAVTGKILSFEELHCHHKIPVSNGGTDRFDNLVIVHKDIHTLIHMPSTYDMREALSKTSLTKSQLMKLNKLRKAAGYTTI